MKKTGIEGYSLVEVLVAIVLIAIITIPTYTCLTMSVKINAASDQMLKDQLAVSSAVETLIAEGYSSDTVSRLSGVEVTPVAGKDGYYTITYGEVSVTTYIPTASEPNSEATEPNNGNEEGTS